MDARGGWTDAELSAVAHAVDRQPRAAAPRDPSNRVADDPRAARARSGAVLRPAAERTGKVSCASATRRQAVPGRPPVRQGHRHDDRRTMSIAARRTARGVLGRPRGQPVVAGARDRWRARVEHGADRTQYAHVAAAITARSTRRSSARCPIRRCRCSAGPLADAAARPAWRPAPARREAVTRCTPISARPSRPTSGRWPGRRASTSTWRLDSRRTKTIERSRGTRSQGCGCSSAGRIASSATTGRC